MENTTNYGQSYRDGYVDNRMNRIEKKLSDIEKLLDQILDPNYKPPTHKKFRFKLRRKSNFNPIKEIKYNYLGHGDDNNGSFVVLESILPISEKITDYWIDSFDIVPT